MEPISPVWFIVAQYFNCGCLYATTADVSGPELQGLKAKNQALLAQLAAEQSNADQAEATLTQLHQRYKPAAQVLPPSLR